MTAEPDAVTGEDGRYPVGTGLVVGFAFGAVVGLVAWFVSGEVTVGVVLYVATGTGLGAAFEHRLRGRPLTPGELRLVRLALLGGLLVGILTLIYAVFLA